MDQGRAAALAFRRHEKTRHPEKGGGRGGDPGSGCCGPPGLEAVSIPRGA